MVDLSFKSWFAIVEADRSGSLEFARERFAYIKNDYLQPFAEALFEYGQRTRKFLTDLDKEQIKRFISETESPAQLATNVGGSSVAMFSPFSQNEFGSGLLGYERRIKMKKESGWVDQTWNQFVKSGSDYKFKEFKTFADYLSFIRSSTKAQYEINTFDWLLYWLIMRLKIKVQNAVASAKYSTKRATMTADPQIMAGDGAGEAVFDPGKGFSGIDMPLYIKDCFTRFFTRKKEELEPLLKGLVGSMNTDNFYNDAKGSKGYNAARIYLWYYLAAKFMSEKPDELDPAYNNIYNFILKSATEKGGKEVDANLIRNFLHSLKWQKSEPVVKYIRETLESGGAFSKLGLGSIAVSIFRNFVRCSDEPEPVEAIVNSMPNFAGVRDYLNNVKDKITCGLKSKKTSLHEDKPSPEAGDSEKIKYLTDHFFKLDYPNWQFAEMQKEKLNNELSLELMNCIKLPAPDEEE